MEQRAREAFEQKEMAEHDLIADPTEGISINDLRTPIRHSANPLIPCTAHVAEAGAATASATSTLLAEAHPKPGVRFVNTDTNTNTDITAAHLLTCMHNLVGTSIPKSTPSNHVVGNSAGRGHDGGGRGSFLADIQGRGPGGGGRSGGGRSGGRDGLLAGIQGGLRGRKKKNTKSSESKLQRLVD